MDEIKEILDCRADPVGQIQQGHISKAFGFNIVEHLSLNHHRQIKILKNIRLKSSVLLSGNVVAWSTSLWEPSGGATLKQVQDLKSFCRKELVYFAKFSEQITIKFTIACSPFQPS